MEYNQPPLKFLCTLGYQIIGVGDANFYFDKYSTNLSIFLSFRQISAFHILIKNCMFMRNNWCVIGFLGSLSQLFAY